MTSSESQNLTSMSRCHTSQNQTSHHIDAASKSEDSTPTSKHHTRQSSTSHSINATSMRKKRIHLKQLIWYVKDLKKQERVDMMLQELDGKHQWSIKDFIYHLVTAEPFKKF